MFKITLSFLWRDLMERSSLSERQKKLILLIILAIISLVVRLYVSAHYYVINKDSTIYLYQAYALKHHQVESLKSCNWSSRLENINLYSITIIPFYLFVKNWILAGQMVSTISGIFTVLILFLIYSRYFNFSIAFLLTLIFAVHPVMVKENAEVMRESLYWFLNVAGIYFFIRGLEENYKFMPFSGVLFCLSGWVRGEGFVLFLVGSFFLLIKRRMKAFIYYTVLPGIAFLSAVIYFSFGKEYFFQEFLLRVFQFSNPFHNSLTESLKRFDETKLLPEYPYFFGFVKKTLWLIAFGVLIHKGLPTIHVPNLVFYFLGLRNLRIKIRKEGIWFLLVISLATFILFYSFVLERWYMEKRYMFPLVFSSGVIMGFGLEKLFTFLKNRGLKESIVIVLIGLYICATSLPTTLNPVRDDKIGIKELGLYLSEISGKDILPKVFTSDSRIVLYAQVNKDHWVCPKPLISEYDYLSFKNNPESLINYIFQNNFRYLVLEERYLPENFDLLIEKLKKNSQFRYHGLWKCSFGRLALFEILREK